MWITWGPGQTKAEASVLAELVELGLVKVVSTDLTMMEVAKRFRHNDFGLLEPLTKSEFKHLARQHLTLQLPDVERETLRASLFEHHYKSVKHAMRTRFQAEVRSIDAVKPTHVLNHYTQGTGLFSASGKKDQFPDAFIFATITQGVDAANPLIVWSQDGDFSSACERTQYVQRVTSMPTLLEALGIQPEGGGGVKELFDQQPKLFLEPLDEALEGYSVAAVDEDDAELEIERVLEVLGVEVLSLYRVNDAQDKYIGFGRCQIRAHITFTQPDWDSAVWDSEERESIPLHTVEGEADLEIDEFAFSFLAEVKNGVIVGIDGCDVKERRGLSTRLHDDEFY